MTDIPEIDRIRKALEAGPTPGPWRHEIDGPAENDMRHAVLSEKTELWIAATYRSGTTAENDMTVDADAEAQANAVLIAACNPAAMKAVLAHIDAQAAEIAAYALTVDNLRAQLEARCVPDEMDASAIKYAHKLALDLECVLADYSGKWWDTAMQTISVYRSEMNAIHERESPTWMGEPVIDDNTRTV